MRIIAKTRLMNMAAPWPEARQARQAVAYWHDLATSAQWDNPNQLRTTDPTASILANKRVVFNILGNRFRLVVKVDYLEKKLFVRFFGTHTMYNAIKAEEV